jgi:hypothetical protein
MKKKIAVLFIITILMLGTSLGAVSTVVFSSEVEEDEEHNYNDYENETKTKDEEYNHSDYRNETKTDDDDEEKETDEVEHPHEEEDIEEEKPIECKEDDDGDLRISSEDNLIKFEKEAPQIRFKYVANETEIEFEADDFSLIEFVDKNNDNEIQSDEIKQKLEFDEIAWTFNYTRMTKGNNTIITVTYYANSTDYEIALIMKIYQRRVTESFTAWDATIVYDVDGGADEVKFDLIISRWGWRAESSKLALLMELESEAEGDVTLESASVDEDQIAIKLNGIKIKVGWVKKAKIVAADDSEEFVNVTVSYKSLDIELEDSEFELELDVYFIYPNFGENKLIHDPSIGIEDELLRYVFTLITPEFLLGTAIAATAITVIAFAFTRRKKKLQPLKTAASLAP